MYIKRFLLVAIASVLSLGFLGACGPETTAPVEDTTTEEVPADGEVTDEEATEEEVPADGEVTDEATTEEEAPVDGEATEEGEETAN
jgi:hypothetical protein